jgi:hypothetical protein
MDGYTGAESWKLQDWKVALWRHLFGSDVFIKRWKIAVQIPENCTGANRRCHWRRLLDVTCNYRQAAVIKVMNKRNYSDNVVENDHKEQNKTQRTNEIFANAATLHPVRGGAGDYSQQRRI